MHDLFKLSGKGQLLVLDVHKSKPQWAKRHSSFCQFQLPLGYLQKICIRFGDSLGWQQVWKHKHYEKNVVKETVPALLMLTSGG